MRALTWLHTAPGQPRVAAGHQPGWRRVVPVALLGMLLATLLVGARVGLPSEVDELAPFMISHFTGLDQELRERGVPVPAEEELTQHGYDGQWFLGQALDPLLRTDLALAFDAPRYRSLRMLLPALGWLAAAGQPAAVPFALLALGVLAVGLGCAACARLVVAGGRSRWWGVTFVLIPGVVVGLAYASAEPLAVALAALGMTLMVDRRFAWAGLALAAAGLTKETYLAFGIGTALYLAVDGRVNGTRWLRPAALVVAPGAALLLAWWAYVTSLLPADNNPYGTFSRFSAPLVGWWEILVAMVQGDYASGHPLRVGSAAVLLATLAVLLAGVVLALRLRQSLLAYLALGWGLFGLIIAGFLLERFASAQRALAPAVLVCVLFLLSVRRREPDPARPPDPPATPATPAAPNQAAGTVEGEEHPGHSGSGAPTRV